jgi:cardiolipin synthase (CMP-forming)
MSNACSKPSARLNLPNLLCLGRLVGSFFLVGIALGGTNQVFLAVFLVLALTDYVDGRLAVWLGQQTTFGARLDSLADISLFAAVLFGAVWLEGPALRAEWAWITAAVVSYAASNTASLTKFRRLPSYHTRAAKVSNFLILVATAALFTGWSVWPLRIATAAVTLANLEAVAITCTLRQWRVNVPSLYHALRPERQPAG